MHTVSTKEKYDELKAASKHFIVKCSTSWCKPCKVIAPVFKELADENPHITFVSIDYEEVEEENIADLADVNSFPTFKFYTDGDFIYKFSGANSQRLVDVIKRM